MGCLVFFLTEPHFYCITENLVASEMCLPYLSPIYRSVQEESEDVLEMGFPVKLKLLMQRYCTLSI